MKKKSKKKKFNKPVIIGLVVVDVLMVAFLMVVFKYDKRWYPGTYINELNVSKMTYDESIQTVSQSVNEYSLEVTGRGGKKIVIDGKDIDLKYRHFDEITDLYNKNHEKFSFSKLFSKEEYEVSLSVDFDREKLKSVIEKSELVKGSKEYKIQEPVNAYVAYSDDTDRVEIVPEEPGNTIEQDILFEKVVSQIEHLERQMNLEDESFQDVYKKPEITKESDEVINQYKNFNSHLYQWLTWDMGDGVTETITPEDISLWLGFNKKGEVVLDKEMMAQWIEEFCLKYKTQGITRTFVTHDGKKIEVENGDYGWRIDYEKTVEDAFNHLTQEKDWELTKAYFDNPSKENETALTTVWEPKYSHKAFKRDFSTPENDWDKENYSEIDISDQKVYVYQDGELVYECECVTGLVTDPERKTRTGCYYIKEKKESYVLTGEDYSTPTKFWIRIMWSGTGYHYMNRKDWDNWSPEIYKTKGSHGCINLKYEDAKKLYELIDFYDAVFIHE